VTQAAALRETEQVMRAPDAPPVGGGRDAIRRHLRACDPDLATLIACVGPCRLRVDRAREPFESLVRAIAHQQLHGRAAEAILNRMITLLKPEGEGGFPSPEAILEADPAALRGCGFSAGKIAAIRAVAEATHSGQVPGRRRAARLSDAALIERLTSLRGIGRWTVEMLLIFSLGRPDIMPVDDFGVREGFRLIKGLPAQPRPRELALLTERWGPYRSAAAWYLWRAADAAKSPAPGRRPNR
jgi:DNA-3-methyladenine glycosylase II